MSLATPSPAIVVRQIPNHGRGIVTERSLARGTLVLTETPFAAVVDDAHIETHCWSCFSELGSSYNGSSSPTPNSIVSPKLRCSGCTMAHYCGRDCQKRDWTAAHKVECVGLKKVAPQRPTASVRLLARVIERRCNQRDIFERGVGEMESNRRFFSDADLESFGQMSFLVKAILSAEAASSIDASDLISLFCRFTCNAMSVTAPGSGLVNVGVGMLPFAALMNHSCAPNAVLVYTKNDRNGICAQVRTITGVASNDEVCLSYIPSETMPRRERLSALQKQYFFECQCSLCTLSVDPLDSLFCGKCVEHFETPKEGPAVCPTCGAIIIADISKLDSLLEGAKSLLDEFKQTNSGISPDKLRSCLTSLEPPSSGLSPQHFLVQGLRTALFDSLIARSYFDEAYPVSLSLLQSLTPPVVSEKHPARTLRLLLTAKLAPYYFEGRQWTQRQLDEAREIAKEAMEGVKVAWGNGSVFFKRCLEDVGLAA